MPRIAAARGTLKTQARPGAASFASRPSTPRSIRSKASTKACRSPYQGSGTSPESPSRELGQQMDLVRRARGREAAQAPRSAGRSCRRWCRSARSRGPHLSRAMRRHLDAAPPRLGHRTPDRADCRAPRRRSRRCRPRAAHAGAARALWTSSGCGRWGSGKYCRCTRTRWRFSSTDIPAGVTLAHGALADHVRWASCPIGPPLYTQNVSNACR